jgi:DNA-binding MarR family transcriptional regulator
MTGTTQTSAAKTDQANELAGGLRTVVSRLAFHLRRSATRQGITPTRLTAMAALEASGPQRPSDLAATLGISAASMSKLAEVLEEGQWTRRRPDPKDQRAYLLSLTDHGVSTLESLRREGTSQLTDDINALAPEQRETLAAALPVLFAIADKHFEPGRDTTAPKR